MVRRLPDVYLSSRADPGGDGSEEHPFNDLAFFASVAGDQGGRTFYLKRGSLFDAPLRIADGASNYSIAAYGTGQRPIISNWSVLLSPTWDAQKIRPTADFGSERRGVLLRDKYPPDPGSARFQWPKYQRFAQRRLAPPTVVLPDAFEHSIWGSDPGAYITYYWDETSGLFWLGTTQPPNTKDSLTSDSTVAYAMDLGAGDRVAVRDVIATGGVVAAARCGHINHLTIQRVRVIAPGGNLSVSRQPAMVIAGESASRMMRGLTVIDSEIGQATDNGGGGLELSFQSAPTIARNRFADVPDAAIRLRGSCRDVGVERNRFTCCGELLAMDADGAGSHHDGGLIRNNLFIQRTSYEYRDAATTPYGPDVPSGYALRHSGPGKNFSNWRVVNNTFLMDEASVLYLDKRGAPGAGDGTYKFKNNLVVMRQPVSRASTKREPCVAVWGLESVAGTEINHNVYQFLGDSPRFLVGATFATDQASYRAAWAASSVPANEQSSLVVGSAAATIERQPVAIYDGYYAPASGSAVQVGVCDTADADYPADDYAGAARTTGTAGARGWRADRSLVRLSSNLDAGRYTVGPVGASWNATGSQDGWDNDDSGTGRTQGDYIVGLSFPGVTIAGPIAKAVLQFGVLTQHVPGVFRVFGQSTAAAPSDRWSLANPPDAAIAVAQSVDIENFLAVNELDVTAAVNEMLAGASWVPGGRLNFWIEAASVGADVTTSNEASGLVVLEIIP